MESANRDDAAQCLAYARSAARRGDVDKARRLAMKSLRLCETAECRDFLEQLSKATPEQTTHNGVGGNSEGVRGRREEEEEKERSPEASRGDYTDEQLEAVNRVLQCHSDYYAVLGVSKDAGDGDLKKRYKRLALQLHPDKNRAPKAEEAFKIVSKAYAVLTDGDKRQRYDVDGEEGLRRGSQAAQWDAEFSPDDIFRMFFGNGFTMNNDNVFMFNRRGNQNYYNRRGHGHSHAHLAPNEAGGVALQFCQILPVLMLVFVSIFSNVIFSFLYPPPPFGLTKTREFIVPRSFVKNEVDIKYYVTRTFSQEYQTSKAVAEVEKEVLENYVWRLREHCQEENWRASFKRRRGEVQKTPDSCQKYQKLSRG